MKILTVFFFYPEYIKTHAKKLMIISDQSQLFDFFFFLITAPTSEIDSKMKSLWKTI